MEKPKSERGDSAATGDDGAAPPPAPDRSPTDSGSLGDALSARATAPPPPSVLAKFGRGSRGGGVDFSARAFLNPASGAGMVSSPGLVPPELLPSSLQPEDQHAAGAVAEKPKSEHRNSAATGDDDAATPPSPDRSPTDSGSLGDASSSRATAPPPPSVLAKFGRGSRGGGVDFSARAFLNPASGAGMVSGPGLVPPELLPSSLQPEDQHAAGAVAEKPKSEHRNSAATGDDDAATPPSPDRSPTDSGSLGDASSSRATAPPQPSCQHAASSAASFDEHAILDPDAVWSLVLAKFNRGRRGGADLATRVFLNPASGMGMVPGPVLATSRAVERPVSDPSDSAAAAADDAPPTPSLRKRLCIGSSTARTAPTSCSTLPLPPPELHAVRAAADTQFMEKAGEEGESAATAAGDTLPSQRRVVGCTIGSASLGAASSAHAPAHLSEQHAASARTFIKPSLLSSTGKDPSLPPLLCYRGIKGKETASSDITIGKSAPWTSTLLPHHESGLEEGHPPATVSDGKKLLGAEEQWDTVVAKWNTLKGQECEAKSEEAESMWLMDCIANQRRLLEDEKEELNRVAEQQQQKEAKFQQREGEHKKKEATLQQQQDALLLERVLLRERRTKQEEEEVLRARRINNPRLPRRNSDEGFMGGAGAAYYADHTIRVLAVNGTNACPDLFLPLLPHGHTPAFTPIPAGIPSPPPTPVPTTANAKPKAEDDMWNKRQLGYIFYLGLAVGLVFLLRPLLPDGYDRFLLAGFASVWGLGSIGLPLGIFGTTRWEKNISRHIGRFISLCFSYMVIYAIYRLAVLAKDAPSAAKAHPSPSPPPTPVLAIGLWEMVFLAIAFLVTLGHAASWIMGCRTGGDRDLEPYEG